MSRPRRRRSELALLNIAILLAADSLAQAQPAGIEGPLAPFDFVIETRAEAETSVTGQPAISRVDSARASAVSSGTDTSDCESYGRRSDATASAESRIVNRDDRSVSLSLEARTVAHGGHYRTCPCVFGKCVGPSGHDTVGTARANARTTIQIRFNARADGGRYLIRLTGPVDTEDSRFRLALQDMKTGALLATERTLRERIGVMALPDSGYLLTAEVRAAAQNEGGCCETSMGLTSPLVVEVVRAPLIEANEMEFSNQLVRGIKAPEYAAVVLVALAAPDGSLQAHCTGTYLGGRTVLTAAHCVEPAVADPLIVVFGPTKNEGQRLRVTDFDFPRQPGPVVGKPRYAADVAVLYLESIPEPAIAPAVLHSGPPDVPALESSKQPLTFVGYGRVVAGSAGSAGQRRKVLLPISAFDAATFNHAMSNGNTCLGDSGGPAFYPAAAIPEIVGVVSKGDVGCSYTGINTRADAVTNWILAAIK
ncbi:MAG: trypsin-like serine protease [Thermoanaerobaculia bacterium]